MEFSISRLTLMSLEVTLLKLGMPSSRRLKLKSLFGLYSEPPSGILKSWEGLFDIWSNLNPGMRETDELITGERLLISKRESLKLLSVSLRPVSSFIFRFG